jgi:hypothetical protein
MTWTQSVRSKTNRSNRYCVGVDRQCLQNCPLTKLQGSRNEHQDLLQSARRVSECCSTNHRSCLFLLTTTENAYIHQVCRLSILPWTRRGVVWQQMIASTVTGTTWHFVRYSSRPNMTRILRFNVPLPTVSSKESTCQSLRYHVPRWVHHEILACRL